MGEKEESKFGKYLGLYFSQFQRGIQESLERERGIDIFGPFKFIWSILIGLWQWIFNKRR